MPDYLGVAITAAQEAGRLQRLGLERPVEIRDATLHDLKLQTDVDCEQAIRAILLDAFPDHAVLGEEGGGDVREDTPTWIVDPLDGTVNYAHRIPYFCCSIALQIAGQEVVGVVYNPVTDELFTAVAGAGAYCNGKRLQVSAVPSLSGAIITTGFSKLQTTINLMLQEMLSLAHTVQKVRIMGAAALDMAYVASGRFDGFMEYGLRTWDIAAGRLLIREAGGRALLTPAGPHTWDVRADNGNLW